MSSYNLGTASGRIEIDGKAGAAGFKVVETAADAMFGVVQRKVDSVEQLGRRLRLTGAAGVAGFGVAIKAAAGFEQAMSGVRAVTGSADDEFETLRQKALQLGSDTVFSASEAATAIEELAKAGIPVEDILNGAADAAVALAAAGGIGLAEASTIAANAMNQFGIDASKVTDVADILAGVANTSAADVSSIGQSLSQAGAVANLAGLSFRDTAIAIGEMADAGINGSDAGTSLKTMLNNLIPTTKKQINEFERLGLLTYNLKDANEALAKVTGQDAQKSIKGVQGALAEYVESVGDGTIGTVKNADAVQKLMMQYGGLNNAFFDAKGNVKDLGGLQGELGNALKGMSKQQKLASLELLFGADAMRATAILSLAGKKGYEEFSKAVGETSAADVAKIRLDNLGGAIEALKGSFETAMITIGNIFLPVVTKIVQGLNWMITKFNELPKGIQTAIGIIAGAVSILLVLIGTIMASITAIALFVVQWYALRIIGIATGFLRSFIAAQRSGLGIMAAWNAGLATSAARTSRLAKVTQVAGKAILLFGRLARAAWVMLLGPVGLVIAAVAGLIAAGVLLYKRWEPFRTLVDGIAASVKSRLIQAWNALKPVMAAVIAAFVQFGNFVKSTLMPVINQVGQFLRDKLIAGFNSIRDALTGTLLPALAEMGAALTSAGSGAGNLWAKLSPAVSGFLALAQTIGAALLPVLMKMGQVFVTTILPILIKIAGFIGGFLIDTLVGLVKAVIQVVTGVITFFTGLINFITGVFSGNWSQAWEGIKQMFSGILNAIVGLVKVWMYVSIFRLFGVGFSLLRGIVMKGLNLIRAGFMAVLRGILGIVRGTFNLYRSIITTVMNAIRAVITRVWGAVRSVTTSILRGIWNYIKGVFNGVKTTVTIAMNAIKTVMSRVWQAIKSAVTAAWNGIKEAVGKGVEAVVGLVKGIQSKITGALSGAGTWLVNAGKAIVQGLIDGMNAMLGKLKDIAGAIADTVGRFIPGSPVKEGPLTSLNRGHAGGEIVRMIVGGIESEQRNAEKATNNLATAMTRGWAGMAGYIDKYQSSSLQGIGGASAGRPSPSAIKNPTVDKAGPVKGGKSNPNAGQKTLRVVGHMDIRNGVAYISGIAEDVFDDFNGDNNRRNR